jgi:uncharacterized membrane protein
MLRALPFPLRRHNLDGERRSSDLCRVAIKQTGGGFIDYRMAPMSAGAKATGTRHMVLNLLTVVIFIVAFWLRLGDSMAMAGIVLTVVDVGVLFVAGYLGGHLAYHYNVGVDHQSEDRPTNIH